MNRGYVKLWRKTIDSRVFADPELFKLWCLCLLKANHKKTYVSVDGLKEPVEVLPGQFITGRYALHSEYYPKRKKNQKSPDTLWRWLKILENMGNLHIKTHSKFSLITIVNWGSFQSEPAENAQQNAQHMHSRCTTDAQQMHTNKNDKNDKNDKNGGYGVASNVVLTSEQYDRLTDLMGSSTRDDYIDRLSTYDKIQKYKSHYLTILNWWKKDGGPKDKTPVDHITCPHCSQYMATFEIKNGKCPVCGKEISL